MDKEGKPTATIPQAELVPYNVRVKSHWMVENVVESLNNIMITTLVVNKRDKSSHTKTKATKEVQKNGLGRVKWGKRQPMNN